MGTRGENREQRIIDHEVRLSRTREIVERFAAREGVWAERYEARQQTAWLRRRLIDLIASTPLEEMENLGLTDQSVRDVRLGTSVREVWERLHPPPAFPQLRPAPDA